ncbi:hypothetical protein ACLOJK_000042 [Asimina triloba]
MHRLSKRSVSAILRAGSTRSRILATCMPALHDSLGAWSESGSVITKYLSGVSTAESELPWIQRRCNGHVLDGDPIIPLHPKRWNSVLTSVQQNTSKFTKHPELRNRFPIGSRYESTAAAAGSSFPPAEKYEYQAEYSISVVQKHLCRLATVLLKDNASDALDKLRFLSVTEPELLKEAVDLDIRIQTDIDNGIITIVDTGIGMTKQEVIDCLGTIAQSGTAKFLNAVKDSKEAGVDSNLIGQFGVGFYSAFLVSDKVVVSTKSPKSDKQYVWEGEANASSYIVREETDPEKLIPRGTCLTLYLKVEVEDEPTDAKKDGEEDPKTEKKKKTKKVVERYWDWELTNETKPIWLRNPKDVSTEEYNEFYKKTFNEYLDPLASSHFTTEGEVEFRSVLFVPAMSPMGREDIINAKTKNIRLYVKRVFISDDFDGELFPRYLSFVRGVVDSNDLPLNVSREILQESRIVRIMRKRLVRKAFDMILGISLSKNKEDYDKFWENFGKHLKLGCIEDHQNHKRIAPLLRFFSSQSDQELISLDEYIENMKPEQKDIYYIAADNLLGARNAPFLERLLEKDYEVSYLF